ncbi:MAG: universal stress protein [Deltaproteobacteria bacterium]|nr:universal stress protein [Deltaproteobacteria bacterium]
MFKKILVPLDGSKLAENALSPAEELAKQTNAEVVLFHAISRVTIYTDVEQPAGICTVCDADEKQKTVVERYLSKLAEQLNSKGVRASWVTSTGERVPSQIIEYAKENDISLIVMSTCGMSGHSPGVLGSVTEKVIKGGAETAILIMCPKGVGKLCRV